MELNENQKKQLDILKIKSDRLLKSELERASKDESEDNNWYLEALKEEAKKRKLK